MNESELRNLSHLRSLIEAFGARQAALLSIEKPEQIEGLQQELHKLNSAAKRRDYEAFKKRMHAFMRRL